MMLTEQENQTEERVQAIRPVYRSGSSPTTAYPTTDSEVVHITVYLDPAGRDIVFWEDILFAFKDALNIRQGTHILPFLRGSDYTLIEPRCIAAVPNTVLDVHIGESSAQQDTTVMAALIALQTALQAVSLSDETVQGLSRNMASAFAREFDPVSKTASNNKHAGDTEVRNNDRHSDSSPTKARASCNTPQQQEHHGSIQDNSGTSSPSTTDTALSQVPKSVSAEVPTSVNQEAVMHFIRRVMAGQAENRARQASQDAANVHIESDDNNSDWTGESSSEREDNDSKDNGQSHGTASSQQEQQVLLDNNIETMSEYLKSLVVQAKQGDVESQYKLARAYETGAEGLSRSDESAMEWYRIAGNQDHIDAQVRMAGYYEEGFSVHKDRTKAFEWYMKAAIQGNVYAQLSVGRMYRFGTGVLEDKSKAMEWYLKAANSGCQHARGTYIDLKEEAESLSSKKKI